MRGKEIGALSQKQMQINISSVGNIVKPISHVSRSRYKTRISVITSALHTERPGFELQWNQHLKKNNKKPKKLESYKPGCGGSCL